MPSCKSATSNSNSHSSDQNQSDSSWPFRSQSTDRSLIRRSMHMYLESAHNANKGNLRPKYGLAMFIFNQIDSNIILI